MRRIAIKLVFAGAAAFLGIIAFLAGETVGRFGQLIWLAVPVILIAGVAMAIGRTRGQTILIAAGTGFLVIVAPATVVAATKDMGSKPNCDGFCMTRTEAAAFVLVLATVWGLILAVSSAAAVAILTRTTARASDAPQ